MNIYYYSRTRTSEKIANGIASRYNKEARQIIGSVNYNGASGFIRGGRAALSGIEDPCIYKKPDEDAKHIILVFPIWAGTFPPAVRTFIKEVGRERLVLVPTSKGSRLKDREGFAKIIDIVDQDYRGKKN